jgi:GNAT superfamily N-acetyltransferase
MIVRVSHYPRALQAGHGPWVATPAASQARKRCARNWEGLRICCDDPKQKFRQFKQPAAAGCYPVLLSRMLETNPEVAESLRQFITVWKRIGKPFAGVDQIDRPGLAITWPDIPFLFYNALFLTEQLTGRETLQSRVQEAAAYMRVRSNGGLFVVCLDNLHGAAKESLPAILDQKNFVLPAIPLTGMAGDILPIDAPGHPALRFEPVVAGTPTLQDLAQLNCVAYDLPDETSRCLVDEHTFWREDTYGFVAYEANKPVSTTTAIIHEDCLYLLLVATAPEARRKGYGEAVLRHALQTAHAATGIRRTVLHATEAGYPLYLRVGYNSTAKFIGCTLKP